MNRQKRSLVLVAVTVVAIFWWLKRARFDVIHYHGQTIKLSKAYFDYEQYKHDSDNIAVSETARVQALVANSPIAPSFEDRRHLYHATGEIAFPGYGSGGFISDPRPDGSELFGVSIEIPRADKFRYIVFRGRTGHYEVVDDFVHDETALCLRIREQEGAYLFLDREGRELFRRPATWPPKG